MADNVYGDSGKELAEGVKAGVAGATTGVALAGTAAAIGAAVGAGFGPFAPIASAVGAALGGLIGFFVGLVKAQPTKEQIAAAKAAHERARLDALNKGWILAYAGETLLTDLSLDLVGSNAPRKTLERTLAKPNGAAAALSAIAKKNPLYAPLVRNLFDGLRWAADQPDVATRIAALNSLKLTIQLFKALGSPEGGSDLQADPFAYLRPPLLDVMRPAFAAAGIDLSDPSILARMRANYDFGAALAARPRARLGIPITRRSRTDALNRAAGYARYVVDPRAFSAKLARFGVDPGTGSPLESVWPWGLDADRFALPPRVAPAKATPQGTGGQSTSVAAPLGLAGLVGLLWWLL